MSQRLPIQIRLDQFEGPLDLLLYLIQSHELDISKISISRITDQYLWMLRLLDESNFEIATEFLLMAATLVLWKSRALLPKEESANAAGANGPDELLSPEALVRQLLEHRRFLQMGDDLGNLPLLDEGVFARANKRPPVERIWRNMNITDLALGYQDLLVRERRRTQILRKETVSLADRMQLFGQRLVLGQICALSKLMSLEPDRGETVVTFLASLELARMKKLRVHQEATYQEIFVELIDQIQSLDLSLATGFQTMNQEVQAL